MAVVKYLNLASGSSEGDLQSKREKVCFTPLRVLLAAFMAMVFPFWPS